MGEGSGNAFTFLCASVSLIEMSPDALTWGTSSMEGMYMKGERESAILGNDSQVTCKTHCLSREMMRIIRSDIPFKIQKCSWNQDSLCLSWHLIPSHSHSFATFRRKGLQVNMCFCYSVPLFPVWNLTSLEKETVGVDSSSTFPLFSFLLLLWDETKLGLEMRFSEAWKLCMREEMNGEKDPSSSSSSLSSFKNKKKLESVLHRQQRNLLSWKSWVSDLFSSSSYWISERDEKKKRGSRRRIGSRGREDGLQNKMPHQKQQDHEYIGCIPGKKWRWKREREIPGFAGDT